MLPPLSDDERARYQWQLWVDGCGEAAQQRLKQASVLVSRIGGVGGMVAYHLAAAGVGRLILAHAGPARLDDLNRQLLMSVAGIGRARVAQARDRLRDLNPHVEVIACDENASADNAQRLVAQADCIASCAPLFAERLALNRAAVQAGKPLVDCAMFEFDWQLTTVLPGRCACLACLYPSEPPHWQRQFPVFGAVAGVVGSLAAVEIIKLLTGIGTSLEGRMLLGNLRTMRFDSAETRRRPDCGVCGSLS